jgi:hypothetical protein
MLKERHQSSLGTFKDLYRGTDSRKRLCFIYYVMIMTNAKVGVLADNKQNALNSIRWLRHFVGISVVTDYEQKCRF